MDLLVLYRRNTISVAYTDGQTKRGSNFIVWYGYGSKSDDIHNMIIDANIIKQEMKEDLMLYDHTCISVTNSQDITLVMCEIGNMIFYNAIQKDRALLVEIIIENCYGDYAVIDRHGIVFTANFLHDHKLKSIYFLSDGIDRTGLYGQELTLSTVSYRMPMKKSAIVEMLSNRSKTNVLLDDNMDFFISTKDISANIIFSTDLKFNSSNYYTITCIEHLAHQLQILSEKEQCNRSHGHSYICRVKVQSPLNISNTKLFLSNLKDITHELLGSAFSGGCKVTTSENIVTFLSNTLCKHYKVLWIELNETENIKVVQYFDSTYEDKI